MLEVQELRLSFGGLQVLNDLSFAVQEREIVAIIGPNGAGKSTTLNVLTGVNRPQHGALRFDGQSLIGMAPHAITRLGIARTF